MPPLALTYAAKALRASKAACVKPGTGPVISPICPTVIWSAVTPGPLTAKVPPASEEYGSGAFDAGLPAAPEGGGLAVSAFVAELLHDAIPSMATLSTMPARVRRRLLRWVIAVLSDRGVIAGLALSVELWVGAVAG